VGAAIVSTPSTPVGATPVVPVVLAESSSERGFTTVFADDGRLIFSDGTGRLRRYDPATKSTTVVTDGVDDPDGGLPSVVTGRSETGSDGEQLLFYRGTDNTLKRLDLTTDAITTMITLGPDEQIERFQQHFGGNAVLMRIIASDATARLHVFDAFGGSVAPAVDTIERFGSSRAAFEDDTWYFEKGSDTSTELRSVSLGGSSTRLVAQPFITDFGLLSSGSPRLFFETRPPGDVTTHWILDENTTTPTPFHTDDGRAFPQYLPGGRFAAFDSLIVSFDGAFANWTLTPPPNIDGYEPPRPQVGFDTDTGRVVVTWSYRRIGDSPSIASPVLSYPLEGGEPTELPSNEIPFEFDPNRIELFYGGVIEVSDNGDDTSTLSYTPARSTTPRIVETSATSRPRLEEGSGRMTYQRSDGTFVTYALEQDESAEIVGLGGDRITSRRLGADREQLLVVRSCFSLNSCPGAGIFVIETPLHAVPTVFTPVAPARLLDTRGTGRTIDGTGQGGGRAEAGSVTEFSIRDRGGIANLADTAILNFTAVNPSGGGFLTVYGCDVDRPTASNLNFVPRGTRANVVAVEAGADGSVCVYTSAETDLIADVTGYAIRGANPRALEPKRYLDTRDSDTFDQKFRDGGRVEAGETVEVDVAGRDAEIGGFSATVLLNITAVNPSAGGFLTVFPCGGDVPLASNLNFERGQTVANAVLTPTGVGGRICIFSSAETHLAMDVNGVDSIFTIRSLIPRRYFDSRPRGETVDETQQRGGRIPAGSVTRVKIRDRASIADDAASVFLNVTAFRPSASGFLTVYPCGIDRPNASNVNASRGSITPNAVFTDIGADGTVCIYNERETDLFVDVSAYVPSGPFSGTF